MPAPQRRQPLAVIERLFREPHRFEFFQAVRLLEQWFAREEGMSGNAVFSQRIQFRNSMSLAFPASEVADFEWLTKPASDGTPAITPLASPLASPFASRVDSIRIAPAFIGLLGAGGTLPVFYTELFAQRELQQKDSAGRAFMDIFLHRAVVLFYQAWRKHRLAVQFESDRERRYLPLMLSLAGVGHPSLRGRLSPRSGGVPDDALAFFAGALQQRPVSVVMMTRLLAHYFDVAVRIESFTGRWFLLPIENQTRLGISSGALGRGAVASERVWQRDLRLRLTIGPMPHARFRRFLPGGPAALALREWLTLLTGVTFEYEVRLALRAADVLPIRLDADHASRLGWDSFLVTRPALADRADPGYDLHSIA